MSGMSINAAAAGVSSQPQAQNPQPVRETAQKTNREEQPSILESMQKAKEEADKRRDQFERLRVKPRYADAPMEAYSRLNRARTPAQAGAAAGYARRKIAYLKMAKGRDKENARRIQTAINQLNKAVTRAAKKRSELTQEQFDEKRRQKLEHERELRRARRLRHQLNSKRSLRTIREAGYFRELEIENRFQEHLAAAEAEMSKQLQSLQDTTVSDAAYAAAVSQYTANGAGTPEQSISAEA